MVVLLCHPIPMVHVEQGLVRNPAVFGTPFYGIQQNIRGASLGRLGVVEQPDQSHVLVTEASEKHRVHQSDVSSLRKFGDYLLGGEFLGKVHRSAPVKNVQLYAHKYQ